MGELPFAVETGISEPGYIL